jgi:lysozyme family protein
MQSNYPLALRLVLQHEGGYVNHPADPGGATMKGVTQRVYDAFRQRRGEPLRPVRQIGADEVAEIYRVQYADKVAFASLPSGVDYAVFDGAVNSGPAQSIKWLQRALGMRSVDGVIGNATLAAAEAHPDPATLVDEICDLRLAFMKSLKTWKTFGKGWASRVSRVRRQARAMATAGDVNEARPMAFASIETAAPASVADAALPPAPTGVPTAGAGAGGAAVALETARQQIEPYAGMWDTLDKVLFALVVLSALIAFGTFVYGLWAARRKVTVARNLDLDTDVQTSAR